MKLTQEEIGDLKILINDRGFKVLEKIAEGIENDLMKQFKEVNLRDEKMINTMIDAQARALGTASLLEIAKSYGMTIIDKEL